MKNDKQIAFTELSFQPFSGKWVTIIQYPKLIFVECLNPHFGFVGYFIHDQICNPNRDYDLNIEKFIFFFQSKPNNYAFVTTTSTTKVVLGTRVHNINNKISRLYSLYSCKIRSWSLRFHQFGVCQVNTAQSSKLVHTIRYIICTGKMTGKLPVLSSTWTKRKLKMF